MTDHEPRLFPDDDAIRRVGEGMIARTLPRADWTHEAHLATCAWLLLERPDISPERDLPDLIRRYNESVGGVNSDSEGYHETITQCFIRAVRLYLGRGDPARPLVDKVNGLLCSEEGRRDWPLCFYDPKTLFSREARLGWVEPDLAPLPLERCRESHAEARRRGGSGSRRDAEAQRGRGGSEGATSRRSRHG